VLWAILRDEVAYQEPLKKLATAADKQIANQEVTDFSPQARRARVESHDCPVKFEEPAWQASGGED